MIVLLSISVGIDYSCFTIQSTSKCPNHYRSPILQDYIFGSIRLFHSPKDAARVTRQIEPKIRSQSIEIGPQIYIIITILILIFTL